MSNGAPVTRTARHETTEFIVYINEMMRGSLRNLLLLGFIVCCLASNAYAWGPATHIGLGTTILDNLALLPAGLAMILSKHRSAFLYGNVAADVVFAKRLSRVKQFCHHWSTGFAILDSTKTQRDRAFAYGYLSHLAADTVAHGKYVPRQVLLSQCSVNFGHLHWELRADGVESAAARQRLTEVLEEDFGDLHRSLREHMTDTFLPYAMNRALFHGMNRMVVHPDFSQTIELWNRYSRWYLSPELLQGYRSECIDRMISILIEGSKSPLVRDDPNGTSALMQLHVRKREMRRLKRSGIPVRQRVIESSQGFEPQTPRTCIVDPSAQPSVMDRDCAEASC